MDKSRLKKVKFIDRLARRVITAGGISAILCMVAILILIAATTLPLFKSPKARQVSQIDLADTLESPAVLAVGVDDYRETGFALQKTGQITFLDFVSNKILDKFTLQKKPSGAHEIQEIDQVYINTYGLLWDNGAVSFCEVAFFSYFGENNKRTIKHQVNEREILATPEQPDAVSDIVLRTSEESNDFTLVVQRPQGRLEIIKEITEETLFGDEEAQRYFVVFQDDFVRDVTTLQLDSQAANLYLGTSTGQLFRMSIDDEGQMAIENSTIASHDSCPITAMTMITGDFSLAVADATGQLSCWFPVREEAKMNLRKIHPLKPSAAQIEYIIPSQRNKSFVSLDRSGTIYFDHMTSEQRLLEIHNDQPYTCFGYSARGDGLVALTTTGQIDLWEIDIAHPEINWKTLFGKVWYEGHPQPEFVWQSSAASDDFEPKLSVVPLLFGTLKGTLYAMLFAIPLAILSAIYTSQFATGPFKRFIKPSMEIMAGVPSVVIGFLIALWLAPVLETWIISFFLAFIMIPLFFFIFLLFWQWVKDFTWAKQIGGYEFIFMAPVVVLSFYVSMRLTPGIETHVFDGDFKLWLYHTLDLRYDQRNSIIIAFGLGFAVIPIIFTMAEDALSSVPYNLTAASLALGASHWQTVRNVVLLSASPGIFAGIIIGFARAVGETMIVLMATGNTPILDWSLFNGMRTLSANIAVEIPEAPVGGTLYRVLFLCAVLLFLMTFVLNTAAELIRERLRKKYGRF